MTNYQKQKMKKMQKEIKKQMRENARILKQWVDSPFTYEKAKKRGEEKIAEIKKKYLIF